MASELSDREIDALIAETITLWTPMPNDNTGWQSPDGKAKHWPGPPEYSTKIANAMEVLAVFQGRGWMWALNGSSEGGHWCVLYPPRGGFIESETMDSPAMAVCLAVTSDAALAAIAHQGGEKLDGD